MSAILRVRDSCGEDGVAARAPRRGAVGRVSGRCAGCALALVLHVALLLSDERRLELLLTGMSRYSAIPEYFPPDPEGAAVHHVPVPNDRPHPDSWKYMQRCVNRQRVSKR
jgi:hypothetical protein